MEKTKSRINHNFRRRSLWAITLIVLATSATAAMLFHVPAVAGTQDLAIAKVVETGKAFSAVTKKVSPAVVFIKATKQKIMTGNSSRFGNPNGQVPDELLERFFGGRGPNMRPPRQPQPAVGQGSGFIISQDGYILTNNHVVGGADKLEVTLHDGRVFEATVVGTDSHTDVAIIRVDASDLPVLAMGDSDQIEVGEWVLAIGSPFGLTGTVTSGIVSAKGRNSMGITDYEEFLQTDAAINPGNSGGPLVNLRGEAIGINTAIVSRSGGYNGIGFAIPMNMAKSICEQLIENGSVTRGYMGVMIQQLTPELAKSFGIDESAGVLIGDVTTDGPAADAGLNRGDVIVELNGQSVDDLTAFRNRVAMLAPGTKAKLVVLRKGDRKTVSLTLGKLPGTTGDVAGSSASNTTFGLSVQKLDEQLAGKLGIQDTDGVVVTQVTPGSPAAAQGIRPGTVIKEVDRQVITNVREFEDAIRKGKESGSTLLLIQMGDHTQYVVLKMEK